MRIIDIINGEKPSLSYEVFPPKTDMAFDSVKHATEEIAKLSPSFMSVTYGAGGGTSRYTLEIAKTIKQAHGVPTLAHLTCVSSTRDTVRARIQDMKAAGIENVMALRGDIPADMQGMDRSNWPYRYAVDLVRELKESGADFCIGGACYPEVHPESPHQKEDIRYLKEKVDAGVEFLTTQMFFDNNLLYNFLYKIREAGITVPVVPGIKKEGTYINLERRMSAMRAVLDRGENEISDYEAILGVGKALGMGDALKGWETPRDCFNLMRECSRNMPCDFTGLTWEMLENSHGYQWPYPAGKEAENAEEQRRLYGDGKFFPPSRKAQFVFEEVRENPLPTTEEFPWVFNTGRGSVGQWHTQSRTKEVKFVEIFIGLALVLIGGNKTYEDGCFGF